MLIIESENYMFNEIVLLKALAKTIDNPAIVRKIDFLDNEYCDVGDLKPTSILILANIIKLFH